MCDMGPQNEQKVVFTEAEIDTLIQLKIKEMIRS